MRNPFLFFADLAKQPLWVAIWVAILALANMGSLVFWPEFLAKVIFVTFMVSAVTMMALYSYFGFEKILGTGHVFWLALVPYILLQLPRTGGIFSVYLVMLSAVLTVSLVLDATDVWKYFHDMRA